jgi:AcrR family transcriptional regulator
VPVPLAMSDDVRRSEPAPDPAPRRERRLDARRNLEAIIDGARRTFSADPGASMQQVAEAAGLHRATVHRHFASRDDLLLALRHRAYDELLAVLRDARLDEDDAPAALARATRGFVDQAERWQLSRYAPTLEETPVTDEMGRLLDGLFARGQREGTIRDDLPPNMLSIMWGGMLSMSGALLEGAPGGEVADVVVRMILGPRARGAPAA